jgi:hypothetical protein
LALNRVDTRSIALLLCSSFLGACQHTPSTPDARAVPRDSSSRLPDASAGIVEVLNGTGRKGVATLVAERLRREGFDVVKVGNAPEKTFSRTIVAQRRDAASVANRVAATLGVHGTCPFRNENLLVDATVFVGRDIEEILPQ